MEQVPKSDIVKEPLSDKLYGDNKSALRKYKDFFVGDEKINSFLSYEIYSCLLSPMPGAVGLVLRKIFVPRLLGNCGDKSLWGRDIHFRHPGKISVGDRVAVDDHCLLDARAEDGICLGSDVIIARDCVLHAKVGNIILGDRCIIGNQAQLSSSAGIHIGNDVGIGGQTYIGGGLYHTERLNVPIMQQGVYSRGPVVIEDDVWIGAGVRILDGVRIGKGSSIGAGAVILEDVPEYSRVVPFQKMLVLPRKSRPIQSTITPPPVSRSANTLRNRSRVLECVYAAIKEVNLQLPVAQRIVAEETSVIFSDGSEYGFDSLALISFIVICEQKIEEDFGQSIDLTSELVDSEDSNPFATLGTLTDHIIAHV